MNIIIYYFHFIYYSRWFFLLIHYFHPIYFNYFTYYQDLYQVNLFYLDQIPNTHFDFFYLDCFHLCYLKHLQNFYLQYIEEQSQLLPVLCQYFYYFKYFILSLFMFEIYQMQIVFMKDLLFLKKILNHYYFFVFLLRNLL